MVTVRFEITGADAAEYQMLNIGERAIDMRPAFEEIHGKFLEEERNLFYTEGASGSGEWPLLKPSTLRRKAAQFGEIQILRETDALFDSLTDDTDQNHRSEIMPNAAFFGTAVDHAMYHQTGAPRANIPKRAPVDITDQQMRDWVRILQSYLVPTDSALAGAALEA